MRIFVMARGYPSKKYKMNGVFEFDQAKALAELGHEVVLLAVDLRSIRRWRKWGLETKKNSNFSIEAINYPLGKIPEKLFYSLGIRAVKKLFLRCEKKYGMPDIVHSHFSDIAYLTEKALEKKECVRIITEHSSAIHNNEVTSSLKLKYKFAYQKANCVIAVSHSLANVIKKEYGVTCKVIPNMINFDNLNANLDCSQEDKRDDYYRFVSVGNLTENKGIKELVECFIKEFSRDDNVKLLIIGDGPNRKEIEEIIQKQHYECNIFLYGIQSRSKIGEVLRKSDCFVLPSKSETFGVAYIEAMSFGLPVIATKCGGTEDFVNLKNGILIPINDEECLQKTLRNMKECSKIKYDSDEIKQFVLKEFSSEHIGKMLEQQYKTFLKGEKNEARITKKN